LVRRSRPLSRAHQPAAKRCHPTGSSSLSSALASLPKSTPFAASSTYREVALRRKAEARRISRPQRRSPDPTAAGSSSFDDGLAICRREACALVVDLDNFNRSMSTVTGSATKFSRGCCA
jgi:hypothetical protein